MNLRKFKLTRLPLLHAALHYFCWWLAAHDIHSGRLSDAAILVLISGGMLAFKVYQFSTAEPHESKLFLGRHQGWVFHDLAGVVLIGAAISSLNANKIAQVPATIPLPGGHMPTELGFALVYGIGLAALVQLRERRKRKMSATAPGR